MTIKNLKNIHPGEILLQEFLIPMQVSQNKIARDIGVSPRRINEICLEKRAISVDTAIRLSRYFGTSTEFWIGLQTDYDIEEAESHFDYSVIHPMLELSQGDTATT